MPFKSGPGQMRDFLKGMVYQDIQEELNIWINELQGLLEDPDGTTDPLIIAQTRGSIRACRNFLQMPQVLLENMEEDARHDAREREEEIKKKEWR